MEDGEVDNVRVGDAGGAVIFIVQLPQPAEELPLESWAWTLTVYAPAVVQLLEAVWEIPEFTYPLDGIH